MKSQIKWIVLCVLALSLVLSACSPASVATQPPASAATEAPAPASAATVAPASAATEAPVSEPVAAPVSGGTVVWQMVADITNFTLILSNSSREEHVGSLVQEPLTRWIGEPLNDDVIPVLATSWESNEDYTEWTINLREGVTWQDGRPFTADDVVFTGTVVSDPECIRCALSNAAQYQVDGTPFVFIKVDDLTVKVTAISPVPEMMQRIDLPIIPAHYFQENNIAVADIETSDFNLKSPIGTGPFKVVEYRKGEAIVLEKNENYWRNPVLLDKIIIRIIPDPQTLITSLQTGEVSMAQIDVKYIDELEKTGNIDIIAGMPSEFVYFRINNCKPQLMDVRVRQALMHAVNRDELVQVILLGNGDVANGPFSPIMTAYENLGGYEYNPEKAMQLIEEAGYVKGANGMYVAENVEGVVNGTPLTLEMSLTGQANAPLYLLLQTYFQAVGIDASIRNREIAEFFASINNVEDKDYEVVSGMNPGSIPDALSWKWLAAAGTKASSQICFTGVNDLYDMAAGADTSEERDEYLRSAARILWDEVRYLPLFNRSPIFAFNNTVNIENAGFNQNYNYWFTYPENIFLEQ